LKVIVALRRPRDPGADPLSQALNPATFAVFSPEARLPSQARAPRLGALRR
jgi:hypothetical protein